MMLLYKNVNTINVIQKKTRVIKKNDVIFFVKLNVINNTNKI